MIRTTCNRKRTLSAAAARANIEIDSLNDKKYFNRQACKSIIGDKVVACGAVVQTGILSGDEAGDILLIDITPLSLGIKTAGGIMTKLIGKNETATSRTNEIFTTYWIYNQSDVLIQALEGKRQLTTGNNLSLKFQLMDIPR